MEKDHSKLSPGTGTFRFGSLVVYCMYATIEQVQQALAEQVEDNIYRRPHRRLGEILRDKGWITEGQMKSVLKEMGVSEA